MSERREHSYIKTLKEQFAEGRIPRREFLRTATLLGLSAGAAYAFVGEVTGEGAAPEAQAQDMPMGGTLRVALRTIDIKNPHTVADDHGDPDELLAQLATAEAETARLRDQLKAILAEALAR